MTKKILILPGDGIGQEVTASSIEILNYLIDRYSLDFDIQTMDVGGTAYDLHGSPIPNDVLNEAKNLMQFYLVLLEDQNGMAWVGM